MLTVKHKLTDKSIIQWGWDEIFILHDEPSPAGLNWRQCCCMNLTTGQLSKNLLPREGLVGFSCCGQTKRKKRMIVMTVKDEEKRRAATCIIKKTAVSPNSRLHLQIACIQLKIPNPEVFNLILYKTEKSSRSSYFRC